MKFGMSLNERMQKRFNRKRILFKKLSQEGVLLIFLIISQNTNFTIDWFIETNTVQCGDHYFQVPFEIAEKHAQQSREATSWKC